MFKGIQTDSKIRRCSHAEHTSDHTTDRQNPGGRSTDPNLRIACALACPSPGVQHMQRRATSNRRRHVPLPPRQPREQSTCDDAHLNIIGECLGSGMASTTLSVSNALGLAVLIALANRHVGGLEGDALRATVVEGTQLAFWIAAAGILISLVAAFALPSKRTAA